jgi:hypothetical protein
MRGRSSDEQCGAACGGAVFSALRRGRLWGRPCSVRAGGSGGPGQSNEIARPCGPPFTRPPGSRRAAFHRLTHSGRAAFHLIPQHYGRHSLPVRPEQGRLEAAASKGRENSAAEGGATLLLRDRVVVCAAICMRGRAFHVSDEQCGAACGGAVFSALRRGRLWGRPCSGRAGRGPTAFDAAWSWRAAGGGRSGHRNETPRLYGPSFTRPPSGMGASHEPFAQSKAASRRPRRRAGRTVPPKAARHCFSGMSRGRLRFDLHARSCIPRLGRAMRCRLRRRSVLGTSTRPPWGAALLWASGC